MKPSHDLKGIQLLNRRIVVLNKFISKCIDKYLIFYELNNIWTQHCISQSHPKGNIIFILSHHPPDIKLGTPHRKKQIQHLVYYISKILTNTQSRYQTIDDLSFILKSSGTKTTTLLWFVYSGDAHITSP